MRPLSGFRAEVEKLISPTVLRVHQSTFTTIELFCFPIETGLSHSSNKLSQYFSFFVLSTLSIIAMANLSAAEFFQAKANKNNAFAAKQKLRIANGEAPWKAPVPFEFLEVMGQAISVTQETNIDDDGSERVRCKFIQKLTTAEGNRLNKLTKDHGKGPIINNQFGTFFLHTVSAGQRDDPVFMKSLDDIIDKNGIIKVHSNACDYNLQNRSGEIVEGWYGALIRIEVSND